MENEKALLWIVGIVAVVAMIVMIVSMSRGTSLPTNTLSGDAKSACKTTTYRNYGACEQWFCNGQSVFGCYHYSPTGVSCDPTIECNP